MYLAVVIMFFIFVILWLVIFVEYDWTQSGISRFSIASFFSSEYAKIRHRDFGYPLDKEVCLDNLEKINDVFTTHDIFFWLSEGTALGFRRHGNFMEWDDDLDIGMWIDDVSKLPSAIKDLVKEGFTVGCIKMNGTFIALYRNGEKIDIDITGNGLNCMAMSASWYGSPCDEFIHTLKFTRIYINGNTYNLPSDEYLEKLYGKNWKTPIKGYKPGKTVQTF